MRHRSIDDPALRAQSLCDESAELVVRRLPPARSVAERVELDVRRTEVLGDAHGQGGFSRAAKRPFSDETLALDLDPLALLVRLATTVPPPGFHTIRYADVLAAASNWRARVVPPPPPLQPPTAHSDDYSNCTTDCATCSPKAKDKPPTHRSGYRPWRELLMRAFKIDVE